MDELSAVVHQAGIGAMAVYLIQWLKTQSWCPWINSHSAQVNRWAGVIVALGTSAGVRVMSGDAQHGWVIAIPNAQVILDTLIHAAGQFSGQQILYSTSVKDTIGGMSTKQMETGTVVGAVVQVARGEEKTEAGERK